MIANGVVPSALLDAVDCTPRDMMKIAAPRSQSYVEADTSKAPCAIASLPGVRTSTDGDVISVAAAMDGATVLLTGSTGYIGSLVLELILRKCPTVKLIKLPIRSQGNVPAEARLKNLFKTPIFRQHSFEAVKHQLEVIEADLSTAQCGFTPKQVQDLKSVSYIMHCASNIRFDLPLRVALQQNYLPAQYLANMALRMPGLQCLTYISTAFVNAGLPKDSLIEECVYPLRDVGNGIADGAAIAARLLTAPPDMAASQAREIMRRNNISNTYFFTKSLTERMLMSQLGHAGKLAIVRPSIVGAVAHQPCPGWIGNTSGFTALILGAASGVIRFTSHDPASIMPLVPGDLVAQIALAAMVATGQRNGASQELLLGPIVHACTSTTNPLSAKRVHSTLSAYLNEDRPANGTLVPEHKAYKCAWLRSDLAFWWASLKHSAHVHTAALVLDLSGSHKLARKLKLGWRTWRQLGCRRFDVNLRFKTQTAQQLQRLIDPRDGLQLVWREEGGDSWLRYLRTYVAGVRHLYRKEEPQSCDMQDYRVAA